MTRQVRSCCAWSVIFFVVFFLVSPDDALCFDTDTLKTAGIVTGITIGVALLVVLIAGTVRDLKGDPGDEDEDDDVWSQSPVLRTLGYRPLDDPLFRRSSTPPEGLSQEGLAGIQEIEAFLEGKVDAVRFGCPQGLHAAAPHRFRPVGVSKGFSLSHPEIEFGDSH